MTTISTQLIDNYKNSNKSLKILWRDIIYSYCKNNLEYEYIILDKFIGKGSFNSEFVNIFDYSIETIGQIYEQTLSVYNNEGKKSGGSFFTPQDVADFMSQQSLLFEDGKKWIDPCCGVGILGITLVKFFLGNNKEKYIKENVLFYDIDEVALFIAHFLVTKTFQKNDKNFYFNIGNKFIKNDIFINEIEHEYDYAILNPPYLGIKENKNFKTSKSGNLYAYFLEKIIDKARGIISITPQSFTHGKNFIELRKLILSKYNLIYLFNFDIVPGYLFSGIKIGSDKKSPANNTRATIMIAKHNESIDHKSTDFLRWKDKYRKQMFINLTGKLEETRFNKNYFNKIGNKIISDYITKFYNEYPTLKTIISNKETPYKLYIGTTPKYFISATYNPLNRSSFKIIYFNSERELDNAYILLNSSIPYIYWRIFDGGMTLSKETILMIPFISITDENLKNELILSEINNKITKLNAGKIIENVKHPMDLLKKINTKIIDNSFHKNIEYYHSNDYFNNK